MRALVLSGGAAYGAFQAGAIEALYELGWTPDIICGSSVGAINGVALASGKSPTELCDIWRAVANQQVYNWRPFQDWLTFWRWNHVLDTRPLRSYLTEHLNFDTLHTSEHLVACFSVDVGSGRLRSYVNRVGGCSRRFRRKYDAQPLTLDSVLASAAIPIVFPWVAGEWDGSVLQYAPLKPAVLLGADEIVVISLGSDNTTAPTGLLQTALRLVDVASIDRLRSDLRTLRQRNDNPDYRHISVDVIRPTRAFGYSKLNFSDPKKEVAILHGRDRAYQIMGDK